MNVTIAPSKARGTVSAPPSKSMAHRLLICSGLAGGTSVIHGLAPSQDILATLDCLKALGASWTYEGDTVTMEGLDPSALQPCDILRCRESGSTLRFFLPICLLSERESVLEGSPKLLSRPLSVYETLCAQRGLFFANDGKQVKVRGKLSGGTFTLPGDVSSQFISGLLFALPLLEENSTIALTGTVESRSYIDLTLRALAEFGIRACWLDDRTLSVPGGQRYRPCETSVEGDYSNAAFYEALNLLGGSVTVTGLREDSGQGDRVYRQYFKALQDGPATLSLKDCPDLGPILFAAAAALHGGTFTETRRLRIKESDRGQAMAEELQKCGIAVTVEEDTIRVTSGTLHTPKEVISGHNDHRIVMAMAVLLSKTGGTICGAEAVAKSFPDFFDRIRELEVNVTNAS
ncbi:MAG: 3-phosphoshikimate 1-carboxyvinyltransferase [Firmicutes bacterium]|nr:3-phosphoshikimate 1-carboxyvinyltransferase [Bacillota bacterium]